VQLEPATSVRVLIAPSGACMAIVRNSMCPAKREEKKMSSVSAILKNEKQKWKERLGALVLLKVTRTVGGERGDSPAALVSRLRAFSANSSIF